MRQKLATVLLVVATAFASFAASMWAQDLGRPDYAQIRAQVYLLHNAEGAGSGIVIAPNLVLTAKHVAAEANLTMNEKATAVIRMSADEDLALMATQVACPCARLADYPAQVGEIVYIVGYPAALVQAVTKGPSEGNATSNGITRLVMTAQAMGGNSGGGVYVWRDREWQLVGVLVSGQGDLTFAVPLENIKAFLAKQ